MRTICITSPAFKTGQFPLGHVVASEMALKSLNTTEILRALRRHSLGDWGNVSSANEQHNLLSIGSKKAVFSRYETSNKTLLHIVTEIRYGLTTIFVKDDVYPILTEAHQVFLVENRKFAPIRNLPDGGFLQSAATSGLGYSHSLRLFVMRSDYSPWLH
jgi:hypothetical protein